MTRRWLLIDDCSLREITKGAGQIIIVWWLIVYLAWLTFSPLFY